MMLQLKPAIPVHTPRGDGEAWFIIDYSPEHKLMFVVCLDKTGQIWTFPNHEIRGLKNVTIERNEVEKLTL